MNFGSTAGQVSRGLTHRAHGSSLAAITGLVTPGDAIVLRRALMYNKTRKKTAKCLSYFYVWHYGIETDKLVLPGHAALAALVAARLRVDGIFDARQRRTRF